MVAADAGEDRARAGDGAAPAPAGGLPRRLLGPVPAGAVALVPRAHRRGAHLQEEQRALGRRRAPDRGRVRRLHRGRRLHADHLRPRVHDRAGLHGHRRRGADQGRQEPAPLEPRHRRSRGARAPAPACADVRVPDDETALAHDPRARSRGCRARPRDFYRHGAEPAEPPARAARARGPVPERPPHDLRGRGGARAARRPQPVLGALARARARDGRRRRPRGRAVRRLRRQPPGARRRPRAPRRARSRPGILYREGIAKLSAFSRACDADGIPLVWLQDISGFDIGVEAERLGLLGLRLEPDLHEQHEHACRCSRCSCARRRARATTRWRACPTSRWCSSRRRSRACR